MLAPWRRRGWWTTTPAFVTISTAVSYRRRVARWPIVSAGIRILDAVVTDPGLRRHHHRPRQRVRARRDRQRPQAGPLLGEAHGRNHARRATWSSGVTSVSQPAS